MNAKLCFTKAMAGLALVVASSASIAESYLCETVASAWVEIDTQNPKAGVFEKPTDKYVLKEENGKNIVKMVGDELALLDECTASYACVSSGGYGVDFILHKQKTFSMSIVTVHNSKYENGEMVEGIFLLRTINSGRCESI